MYVTVTGKGKYRVIQFREDTRIPGTNKRKAHVVKTIGNYEKLLSENPNIIQELKEEAKKLTLEKKDNEAPITLEVSNKMKEYVVSQCDLTYGARDLQNLITQNAKVLISQEIISGNLKNDSTITFDWNKDNDEYKYFIKNTSIKPPERNLFNTTPFDEI